MDRLGPPAERLDCALCPWRSETDWEASEARPVRAEFEWAAHVRLHHPLIADWFSSAFGARQN